MPAEECSNEMTVSDTLETAGLKAWIITDGRAGMNTHCIGIAEKLALDYAMKTVDPQGIWRLMAPWGPVSPRESIGRLNGSFSPPWPQFAIASGRRAIPYIRAVRRKSRGMTFTIILQDPRISAKCADVIWVPQHDRMRGPNVVTTLTAPHKFSPQCLRELRSQIPPEILSLSTPRVAVILGGTSASHYFSEDSAARLAASLKSIADLGASLMISVSRRTPDFLTAAVKNATSHTQRLFYEGQGNNPYADFLAHADVLVVTGDSVNMTGEACATGRPVYVFHPDGGTKKFVKFHQALEDYGATRTMPDKFTFLDVWSYEPIDSATIIAQEILKAWKHRQSSRI